MEKVIVVKNKNDNQLVGILHLPEGIDEFPLVIICHGFGKTKTEKKFIRLARALTKENIACFRFDFEGCGDSEGDFKKITIENQVQDLGLVFDKIKKRKEIDANNISFVGYSMGALICSLFVAKNKAIQPNTIVMWAPAFNQKELLKIWNTPERLREWKEQGCLYTKGKELIQGIDYLQENEDKDYSSILSKIKSPLIIFHGQEDEAVPVSFSKELEKNYSNIKLSIILEADHRFEDYYIQQKLISETILWIKKFN